MTYRELVLLLVFLRDFLQDIIEAHVRVESTNRTSGWLDGSNARGERQGFQPRVEGVTMLLGALGGVEHRFVIRLGDDAVRGVPDSDAERSREDGKTSSVHFVRFALSDAQIAAFRDPAVPAMVGCDDPRYAHLTVLNGETRKELARDFA